MSYFCWKKSFGWCQAKRRGGMKDARHHVYFCFRHSSSLSPRIITRVRGRFYGLWLENKKAVCFLQAKRWFTTRHDKVSARLTVRMCEGCRGSRHVRLDVSVVGQPVWSPQRSSTHWNTAQSIEKLWLSSRYQYLTSSSHIISTVSTSFSGDHGLFYVVHNWNWKPNQ